jgi:AcrR family transcriptional regulator
VTPPPPANARSRRTRARLLAAARELLERDGFDALTMAAVADHAGVTRRAVYLHFASRAELVAALFDHVGETEGLTASIERVWAAPDATAALQEWARHIARFHPQALAVTRAVEQVHRRDPDAAAHRERYLSEQLAACRRLTAWLDDDGTLSPRWTVETASEMLWGLIATDMLERLLVERRWTREELADRLGVLLGEAFVARAPG